MLVGYEMLRTLTKTPKAADGNAGRLAHEQMCRWLLDPGADLVVCDEGHRIKNDEASISRALKRIKTR